MLELQEYLETAEKAIRKWGCLAMLRDEDSISYVAYKMMLADDKFDGRGSRNGFRMSRAKYAIRALVSSYKKKQKDKMISLNIPTYSKNSGGDNVDLYNQVDSGVMSPDEICMSKENNKTIFDTVINSKLLTIRQKACVLGYYRDGRKLGDLAEEFNVTHQAINISIKEAIEKLKCLT